MKIKKMSIKDIVIKNLNPGDFIFLIIDPEELSGESIDELDAALKKFEKKLPPDVTCVLLPSIKSIHFSSDNEIVKLFIDAVVNAYNTHFNEIYVPYVD